MKLSFLLVVVTFLHHLECASAIDSSSHTMMNMNSNGAMMVVDEISREFCIKYSCSSGQYFKLYSNNESNISPGQSKIHLAVLMPAVKSELWSDKPAQTLATTLPVIELAIRTVKEQKMLEGIELVIHFRDTASSSTIGPLAAFDLHNRKEADVFLGPIADYVLAPVARYASVWGTPILTTGGLAGAFDNKQNFPTLTRVLCYSEMTSAIVKITAQFNWNLTGFFFHNNEDRLKGHSDCSLVLAPIKLAQSMNPPTSEEFESPTYEEIREKLAKLSAKSRIIIMCANPKTIREIMIAAEDLNMIDSGEYVFFNVEIFGSLTQSGDLQPWNDPTDDPTRNEKARKAFEAVLTITTKKPEDEEYQNFSKEVKSLASRKYNHTFGEHEQISQFVSSFHDAVLLFARALNESITESGVESLMQPLNGTRLSELMRNTSFRGITGNVFIDENGDRLSDYSLLDLNPDTSHLEVVANYYHDSGLSFVEGKSIHWAGGRKYPPADRPVCGFDNSLCPDDSAGKFAILSIVLSVVVILMAIGSFVTYKHYKLEAEISSMTWKVNWNEVIAVPPQNLRGSLHSRTGSQLSGYSGYMDMMGDQIYIPIACFKGNRVAIKKINTSINLTRSLMMELKTMKDIQHDHLVRFYGAVIEEVPCLLTEYCPKGSLPDILENHEINLDWMFKLSLMHDLAKGMSFLHTTPIHSHGQLKSSNCVVDSRFVLKVADFGLHSLRKNPTDDSENKDSHEYWKKYLWTAPEHLRQALIPERGSQKGDVYSFALIVQEIVSRQGVFYLGSDEANEKTPKEIIQLVSRVPAYPHIPFRPIVEDNKETCCDINNLMTKCWAEDPIDRPDFAAIKSSIRKINKENESGNILDNLLKRMEHYANNLESLVEERTRDYFEEKKRCEELLYQLLPVSIASQLINGQSVIAKMYDQVTIYFSDIVGFTQISAESTPMQVVNLLNDLYTCFDKIVGHFDVYKVETIGDAYMVVSGLPERNGDLHAREIARMALALLTKVRTFKIHHRPDDQLKLRIGIHSGPCCAGVVGQKMPRYCLFGDTVNTASRMESNGEALKIHMSHTTKQILDKFGTFDIAMRGFVSIKGKGEMMTFWLNGEKQSGNKDSPISHLNNVESSLNAVELGSSNNNTSTNHEVGHAKEKVVAVVPPLSPQNSFSSKRSVIINSSLNNLRRHSHSNSLKELHSARNNNHESTPVNGKKSSFFGKGIVAKQDGVNGENLQPLLGSVK